MYERVLVTGATGFVGRGLTACLVNLGKPVAVVTRSGSTRMVGHCRNITWTGDAIDLVEQITDFNPHVIFHLATNFVARHETKDIPQLVSANVTFGTVVLEAARIAGAKVIVTGTSWQHFEGADYSPVSLYAATKQALTDVALYYALNETQIAEVTLFDTYGPGDTRGKLISQLLAAAKSQKPLEMGSGHQLINLLFVTDVVAGLIQAADLEERADGDIDRYVLRAEKSITIRNLVEVAENVIGRSIPVMWGMKENRKKEMLVEWEFGQTLPNWHPSVHLADGIARCWREFDSEA